MLDCKKLSMEVCMHAAQNELLPLRVVVQVLFFEQARAIMSGGHVTELPSNIKVLLASHDESSKTCASFTNVKMKPADDQWNASGNLKMKLREDLDENYVHGNGRSSTIKASCVFPTRPKRMLSKLWSSNRSAASEKK